MEKIITKIFMILALLLLSWQCYAANLLNIYSLALKNDPTFKSAEADMMANKQNLGIARATLLPSLDLSGQAIRSYNDTHSAGTFYNTNLQYTISLAQPLFNLQGIKAVKNAQAIVKQAQATYSAAAQDLMIRVATAYFSVLEAYDDLRFSKAEQRALARQLQQNEERYKVGLIAITDVQQTRARYDSVSADVITATNNIANRLEELREITGEFNNQLAGLKQSLPLVKPDPTDINKWVRTAIQQNYTFLATRYAEQAAKENVGVQSTARWPTVNAVGSYQYNRNDNAGNSGVSQQHAVGGGVSVDFPVFQGGLITAQTRQAAYQYAQASAETEKAYRNVVANARKAYLGVLSGIAVIRADTQAVVSNESALKATQASYIVGTQTMFDVLLAQSNLYAAQQSLARDQYSYLLNTLALKQAAGTLSMNDLAIINSWLGKEINFSKYDTRNQEPTYGAQYNKPKTVSKKTKKSKPVAKAKQTQSQNASNKTSFASYNGYTIQLAANTNKQFVIDYINKKGIQNKAAFFKTTNKGKPWYEVVYGRYPSYQQALAALKKLPTQLTQHKPWIRPLKNIRASLNKQRT